MVSNYFNAINEMLFGSPASPEQARRIANSLQWNEVFQDSKKPKTAVLRCKSDGIEKLFEADLSAVGLDVRHPDVMGGSCISGLNYSKSKSYELIRINVYDTDRRIVLSAVPK